MNSYPSSSRRVAAVMPSHSVLLCPYAIAYHVTLDLGLSLVQTGPVSNKTIYLHPYNIPLVLYYNNGSMSIDLGPLQI